MVGHRTMEQVSWDFRPYCSGNAKTTYRTEYVSRSDFKDLMIMFLLWGTLW
jgi:hypothetical protein